MIKASIVSLMLILSLGFSVFMRDASLSFVKVMYWTDLPIANQIQICSGLIIMCIVVVVASVIFRSVWIRKGYEGLDDKLEGKEVGLLLAHVIAFFLLLTFVYLITFNSYMETPFPDYAFWICAAGFVGPEVYILINFLNQLRITKKEEK